MMPSAPPWTPGRLNSPEVVSHATESEMRGRFCFHMGYSSNSSSMGFILRFERIMLSRYAYQGRCKGKAVLVEEAEGFVFDRAPVARFFRRSRHPILAASRFRRPLDRRSQKGCARWNLWSWILREL